MSSWRRPLLAASILTGLTHGLHGFNAKNVSSSVFVTAVDIDFALKVLSFHDYWRRKKNLLLYMAPVLALPYLRLVHF